MQPPTVETFSEKIRALAGSGKETAGLNKKRKKKKNMMTQKSHVSGFSCANWMQVG